MLCFVMLSIITEPIKLIVIIQTVIMLRVMVPVCLIGSVVMLSITNEPIMLIVILQTVIVLRVMVPVYGVQI
jgi:hypothetical protein